MLFVGLLLLFGTGHGNLSVAMHFQILLDIYWARIRYLKVCANDPILKILII